MIIFSPCEFKNDRIKAVDSEDTTEADKYVHLYSDVDDLQGRTKKARDSRKMPNASSTLR